MRDRRWRAVGVVLRTAARCVAILRKIGRVLVSKENRMSAAADASSASSTNRRSIH
jgi:hypothetical protein